MYGVEYSYKASGRYENFRGTYLDREDAMRIASRLAYDNLFPCRARVFRISDGKPVGRAFIGI